MHTLRRLWAGKVDAAVGMLERYRRHARDEAALDGLIAYLHARGQALALGLGSSYLGLEGYSRAYDETLYTINRMLQAVGREA